MRVFIHFRRRFALTPWSSASLDTDTPGSRQAETRRSFDAGSNRRRPFRPTSLTCSFCSSSSITRCPTILVDTSCIRALNSKRCGEIRAYTSETHRAWREASDSMCAIFQRPPPTPLRSRQQNCTSHELLRALFSPLLRAQTHGVILDAD